MPVVRVTEERLLHAAGVAARAFLDDPMVRWMLGGTAQDYEDREDLEDRMTRLFTVGDEDRVASGTMWETEDGDGACVWLSPEAAADLAEDVEDDDAWLAAIAFDGGARHTSMWDWIGERTPAEPLWYLEFVGVEPRAQGRGIVTTLIEHGLAMAHEAGQPAFLVTDNPRLVAYYEGFGFRTLEDADVPLGGPHAWFMRREP